MLPDAYANVQEIDLSRNYIKDLCNIEQFKYVISLNLKGNRINSLLCAE